MDISTVSDVTSNGISLIKQRHPANSPIEAKTLGRGEEGGCHPSPPRGFPPVFQEPLLLAHAVLSSCSFSLLVKFGDGRLLWQRDTSHK